MPTPSPYVRNRWRALIERSWTRGEIAAGYSYLDEILLAYSEPARKYHTISHIEHGLHELDEYFTNANPRFANQLELEFAWWFHDFFHVPGRSDNEELSAKVALHVGRELGLNLDLELVFSLINVTKHTQQEIPRRAIFDLMLDIDLSILGQKPEIYDNYARNIRLEYSHVDEQTYVRGRINILEVFKNTNPLYRCPPIRGVLEKRAKSNLEAEIQTLRSRSRVDG